MIIVTGLPRSGTSLMMQTLDILGFAIIGDKEHKDKFNRKGYYECLHTFKGIDTTGLEDNQVVKVILQNLTNRSNIKDHDKIIVCLRHPYQVAFSQSISKFGSRDLRENTENFLKVFNKFSEWKKDKKNSFLVIDYDLYITKPEIVLEKISKFLGVKIEEDIVSKIKDNFIVDDSINTYVKILNGEI